MKKTPTNHIFIDDKITDAKLSVILNQLENKPQDNPVSKNCCVMVGNIDTISSYLKSGQNGINKYVILTDHSKVFKKKFIPNNIIDTSVIDFVKIPKMVNWMLNGLVLQKHKVFVTSDHHFNHANIIKYCNRPWNSGKDSDGNIIVTKDDVFRMNEDMIERWNSVVGKTDIVYHLGDFALGDRSRVADIVKRLNGSIRLILGNHDTRDVRFYYESGFDKVYDKSIVVNDFYILSHEPIAFLGPNNCFANIYGHVHNSDNYRTFTKCSCCVCVERWDYMPVEWSVIEDGLKKENDDD